METEADGVLTFSKEGPDGVDRLAPLMGLVCLIVAGWALGSAAQPMRVAQEFDVRLVCATLYGGAAIAILAFQRRYRRRTLGTWRVGPEAIEFIGTIQPSCRLAWSEIERVQWSRSAFKLVGPAGLLHFEPVGLVKTAQGPLHDRVAAHLAARFDLEKEVTVAHEPTSWVRIIDLALLGIAPFLAFCLLIPYLSDRQWRWGMLGLMVAGLGGVAGPMIFLGHRRRDQQLWRYPRGVAKTIDLV